MSAHLAASRVSTAYAVAARGEKLSPLVGHQFVAEVTRAQLRLSDALSHSADGHRFLRRLATRLGYDVTSYGDGATDPHEAFTGADSDQPRETARNERS